MDDDLLDEGDRGEKDHLPPSAQEDESIVVGLFAKMRSYLSHYNSIKIKYKSLAVTWFIASFFGCGYILGGKEPGLDLNGYLAIVFITTLSASGLSLLAFLDIAVYHKLIESICYEIMILEDKFPFLMKTDRITVKMLSFGRNIDPQIFDGIFHAFLIFVMLLISSISFSIFLGSEFPWLSMFVLTMGILLALLVSCFIVRQSYRFGVTYRSKMRKIK